MPFNANDPSTYGQYPQPPPEQQPWEPTLEELAQMYAASQQAAPPPGFLDRLAMGLQGIQGPPAGIGAGLAGLAQGFSGARMGRMQRADQGRARQNQANLAATQAFIQSKMRPGQKTEGQIYRENRAQAAGTAAGTPAKTPATASRMVSASEAKALGISPGMYTLDEIDSRREMYSAMKPPAAGVMGSFGGQFDPDAVYQGMKQGTLAPDPSGYSRGQWGMIATSAAKDSDKSFNPKQAGLDYMATKTFWGTRNRQQQLSIRQNLERLPPSLDLVLEYSNKLKPLVARYGVKVFNRAAMIAATNGAYGPEAQDVAQNLATQINDTTFELQQVYGNGYSPTDQALKLAAENLSKDWNDHVLASSVDLAKRNVGIRANSIEHTVASTPSNPSGMGEQSRPDWIFDPVTKKLTRAK